MSSFWQLHTSPSKINDLVLVISLKSSFFYFTGITVATMTWFTITEYMCHKWPRICFVCRNHNPILSLFTRIMQRVLPVEQERLTLSDHSSSHPYFSWVRGARSLFLCVVFCRSLSVYSSILFWSLYWLSFLNLRLLTTLLVSSNLS
jgi:hypothetical protein